MKEFAPEDIARIHAAIRTELGKVIVGQERIVRLLLVSLFARGHCLLVGVPGLAKTLLVKSLAESLQLEFRRVQFTPDLMPADIIGSELLQEKDRRLEFEYQPGPIFTHLLLADEINRTPPKTQSALLEAMQERRVTVGHETRPLPDPFLVIATQNPIEQEGTYPLPEAQLDRFMFSLNLDYPAKAEEVEIVRRTTLREPVRLAPVASREQILAAQNFVLAAPVSDHVIDYAVELATATRPKAEGAPEITREFVEWGAGPRASQYLVLGAKALALLDGCLTPETHHIREVAPAVLQHRVITNYRATGAGKKAGDVVAALLATVPEKAY
jgi:MoxR-like ATPase